MERRLFETPVLLIDCQTTGMTPARGDLIEIAWTITSVNEFARDGFSAMQRFLIRLPEGKILPTPVARLTGLTDEALAAGESPEQLWHRLAEAVANCPRIVAHFARFEMAFLKDLRERFGGDFSVDWDFLCTHQFAKRALPALPAWGLKAVTGYLGEPLKESYRARAHVEATARVWKGLITASDLPNDADWDGLKKWMTAPAKKSPRRNYLITREQRLGLTRQPGVYRMVAHDGSILYVGKATSLRNRVNQYFKLSGKRGRLAEMMAQVADLSLEPTETPLEAALFETDEIKRLDPPYNTSLKTRARTVAYWSLDLATSVSSPDREHPFGPFGRNGSIECLSWLMHASRRVLELEFLFPDLEEVEWIFTHLDAHAPATSQSVYPWLRWGQRLLRAGVLDDEPEADEPAEEMAEEDEELPVWTPETVARRINRTVARAYQAWQRRRLLLQLADACVAWDHDGRIRYLKFEAAHVKDRGYVTAVDELPTPGPYVKRGVSRYRGRELDLGSLDRLVVLRTELYRLRNLGTAIYILGASQFGLGVNQAPDHDSGRKRRADNDAADGDHLR